MTRHCLVCISTLDGTGFAEVQVNSVHQLAMVMPGAVISYEVQNQGESTSGANVEDDELFDLLMGAVQDIGC